MSAPSDARRPSLEWPLVLFDIDGTLISAFGAGLRSLKEAFEEVFGRPDAVDGFNAAWFAGRNDIWLFRELAVRAGIPADAYERSYSRLEEAYLRRLGENMTTWKTRRILPGVTRLLDLLEGAAGEDGDGEAASAAPVRGADLGLVTGNLEAGARIKLDAFDLFERFATGGFGSDAIERSEIARIARERFERHRGREIAPERVVLVGDTIHDVAAARACGYAVIAVATGTTSAEALADADLVLEDLSDPAPVLDLVERHRPAP